MARILYVTSLHSSVAVYFRDPVNNDVCTCV